MSSMPQTSTPAQSDIPVGEIVLGVDTHKDAHVAAVVTAGGMLLGSNGFPTTATGYQQLLAWASSFGQLRRAGVEGTGSYGAALTRFLLVQEVQVFDVNQPDKATRRRRGKTDALDAEAAAHAVLNRRATAIAKTGDGPAEMLRMFKLAKNSALKARTQAINQLKAVLVNADPAVRDSMTGLGPKTLIRRCAELGPRPPVDTASATAHTLHLLACRIQQLTAQIDDLQQCLQTVITAHQPQLLDRVGIGPDNAATLMITVGDNPERLHSEASFAALCGSSPVEASSGKTNRHRVNRGGDRQANAALYRIVLSRLHVDPATRAYRDRRIAEGKTKREIIRCLKRYVAREVYTLLRPAPSTTDSTAK